MNWISIQCIINANSEVIRINYGRSTSLCFPLFLRNCGYTAIVIVLISLLDCEFNFLFSSGLRLSMCSSSFILSLKLVLALSMISCLFDAHSSQHADAKRNCVFWCSVIMWKSILSVFTMYSAPHSLHFDLIHDQWFVLGVLDIIFERKEFSNCFRCCECYIEINLWIVDLSLIPKSSAFLCTNGSAMNRFSGFTCLAEVSLTIFDVFLATYVLISDSTTVCRNLFCHRTRLSCSISAALSFSVLPAFQIRSNRHYVRLTLYFLDVKLVQFI
jgi:hypothetical protein